LANKAHSDTAMVTGSTLSSELITNIKCVITNGFSMGFVFWFLRCYSFASEQRKNKEYDSDVLNFMYVWEKSFSMSV